MYKSRWLRKIFMDVGLVTDTFMYYKKWKNTDSKFGFVKFGKKQDALAAITYLYKQGQSERK